jgi:hypothetical protein
VLSLPLELQLAPEPEPEPEPKLALELELELKLELELAPLLLRVAAVAEDELQRLGRRLERMFLRRHRFRLPLHRLSVDVVPPVLLSWPSGLALALAWLQSV